MTDRVTLKLLDSQRNYLQGLLQDITGQPLRLDVGQLVGLYWGCRVTPGMAQVVDDCRTKGELYAAMQHAARALQLAKRLTPSAHGRYFLKDDPQPAEGA